MKRDVFPNYHTFCFGYFMVLKVATGNRKVHQARKSPCYDTKITQMKREKNV